MAEGVDGSTVSSDKYSSSRLSHSLHMTNDYYNDPFCEICSKTRSQNHKPDGFCNNCVQFLCEDCLTVHKELQGARNHVIRRGDDMPKSMADKPPKYEFCEKHKQRRKDQFCDEHKVLLCHQCALRTHRRCPVKSVDDAAKTVSSSEIDSLYDKVSDFKASLSSVVTQIDLNSSELGKQKEDTLKDADDIKNKVIDKINELFKDMKSETESRYKTYTADVDRDRQKIKDILENLECTLDDIDTIKGKSFDTKAFLKKLEILQIIEECKTDANNLYPATTSMKMAFFPDKWINEFLTLNNKMGSISIVTGLPQLSPAQPPALPQGRTDRAQTGISGQAGRTTKPLSEIKAKKLTDYNIKLNGDGGCWITGIAITNDGRRLLADCGNSSIKLFSQYMTSVSTLSLPTEPCDIAVTGDGEAVVSCENEPKLLILGISDGKLSIKSTVKLCFKVYGITPYKDKLIATCPSTKPPSVKLIDLTGRVYWSTDTDQKRSTFFTRIFHNPNFFHTPWYVTCYDDKDSAAVIVSDSNNDTLTLLNADTGDVITRRQVDRKGPKGVTTNTVGNIYVRYYNTDEVAVLSKDLSKEKILLFGNDVLSWFPQAIVYDSVDHQLLISYCNCVSCFKLE